MSAGEITILDHDTVELSNLHRQVLHTEDRVGMSKAASARIALQACVTTPLLILRERETLITHRLQIEFGYQD